MYRTRSLLLLIILLLSACACLGLAAPAQVVVTTKVITEDVEPIGANLTTITGGTNFAVNNHVWNSGFEPIVWRKMARINRAGTNWFEWDGHGGPGYWNLAWTGLGNGATARFYRIVDDKNRPLSYGAGKDMNNTSGAHRVVFLGQAKIPMPGERFPDGGYIANDERDGNKENDMMRVYLDRSDLGLRFGDYVYLKKKTLRIGPQASPPDLRKHFTGDHPFFNSSAIKWEGRLVTHPKPIPKEFTDPGESCLHVTFPQEGEVTLSQYVYYKYDKGEGQWYSQLTPGARYRVSLWMRQQGLGNGGRVRFVFNKSNEQYHAASQRDPWVVTDRWKQFTCDFTAPQYPEKINGHISHGLEFTGPGQVWLDNFLLYRYDEKHDFKPFTPHEISFDELMRSMPQSGKKPALRFYGTIYHHSMVESMFTDYSQSGWNVAWNMGPSNASSMTIAQCMQWAYRTGDSPRSRVVPYLTCIDEYTEDEWKALVEYLGVPYDPSRDTPARKPYAYLRYRYREGNGAPWTDAFREILVEYGNETWHNGAGGYGWDGWGPPGYVHHGGQEYGLFARFMFDENVMQMPEWKQYDLGRKIKFVLGGNYQAGLDSETAYAEEAIRQRPKVRYIGHANYVGPKWETADASPDQFNDAGVQETLIARVTGIGRTISDAAFARDRLREQGIEYDVIAYEGGPSGYWQNKDNPIIDEYYGKSAAMGLSALDAWLYSGRMGFKYQCYLGFASGKWWTSHTMPEAGGFRPHPGWLALQMRNRYVRGDRMVEVEINGGPSIHRKSQSIPALAAYAFQDDGSYSVFLLNRSLHESVEATLRLPKAPIRNITLHKLTRPDGSPAKPQDNNLEKLQVKITSVNLTAPKEPLLTINEKTGATAKGLPPGAIYLYVIEQ
ncbi:MAG: hypothetical protein JW837_07010 [Sedimentisphaerales bacterium]|nr:hypothetical protein [Sedimentisphaerales bacterium]